MADNTQAPEERFLGYIGEMVDNDRLQCKDCKYCIEGNVSECDIYAQKPASVLKGENTCGEYEKK